MESHIIAVISIVIAVFVGTQADCPTECPDSLVDPTCGSDGHLYYSECQLQLQKCGTGVTKVPWSECTSKCEGSCGLISEYTCGSDGVVYANKCSLLMASCGQTERIKEEPMEKCTSK